jgi:hypothetical protein
MDISDRSDREAAMEKGALVDCPYTDASYDIDTKASSKSEKLMMF